MSAVRIGAVLLCATAAGCAEIATVSWAPLDIDQLEQDVENPTAPLNAATIEELHTGLADEVELVKRLVQIGRLLVATSGEGDAPSTTRDLDVNLQGTQVYIKIACPGPVSATPDPDFSFGSFTIYSAGLSEQTIDTWGAQGDMLGVLDECVSGQALLDGEIRMYYDTVRNLLGSDFDLEWTVPEGGGHLALPVLDEHDPLDPNNARARLLFTTESDGTLVLEQSLDMGLTEYIIRGVDGEVVCDDQQVPACPPP